MNKYEEISDLLERVGKTREEMNKIWGALYVTNWKVRNLTDGGKHWSDLNESAIKSMISIYEQDGGAE